MIGYKNSFAWLHRRAQPEADIYSLPEDSILQDLYKKSFYIDLGILYIYINIYFRRKWYYVAYQNSWVCDWVQRVK